LHRNAWATGPALPQTPLGELASLPRPLAPLRALLLEERGGRGVVPSTFWEKVTTVAASVSFAAKYSS